MADLTINYQREQVVDFSQPFLDLGISLLFVNAPKKYFNSFDLLTTPGDIITSCFFRGVNLFAFVAPLSIYVWILMLLALALVSVAMYAIAKLSPYETEDLERLSKKTFFLHFCTLSLVSLTCRCHQIIIFRTEKIEILPSPMSCIASGSRWPPGCSRAAISFRGADC